MHKVQDLIGQIDSDTFVISDTHFGHHRVMIYEPVRLEYLADYDDDSRALCDQALEIIQTSCRDDLRDNKHLNDICYQLIPAHDAMLVEKWNSVVPDDALVVHLGDYAFKKSTSIVHQLNGRKILMIGNHDVLSPTQYISLGWDYVAPGVMVVDGTTSSQIKTGRGYTLNGIIVSVDDSRLMLSHYPVFNQYDNPKFINKYADLQTSLENLYSANACDLNFHGHIHSMTSKFKDAVNVSVERCTSLMPMQLGHVIRNRGK